MLHNYIISIKTADKRRQHIINEFGKQKIPFQFFDAVTPSEIAQKAEKYLPNLLKSSLTQGEIACFLSHLAVWQLCLEQNLPYIAVFEDDVILGKNANLFLNTTDWIEERFHCCDFILRLETFLDPVKTRKSQIKPYENRRFPLLAGVHYGAAGYIISNNAIRLLLKRFINLASDEISGIDILLFSNKNMDLNKVAVYQLNSAICIQELQYNKKKSILTSQLEEERFERNQAIDRIIKKNRTIKQKVVRGLNKFFRIFTKVHRMLTIVPFK